MTARSNAPSVALSVEDEYEKQRATLSGVELFMFDFGWGDLPDHWQDCSDCNGTGLGEADGSGPPDECGECDGHGRWRWGSFYEQDCGLCAFCEEKGVRIAEMFEGGGRDGEGWICLPCYVMRHRDECGCNQWKKAEEALPQTNGATDG